MAKLLIIDNDAALRGLLRRQLGNSYEFLDAANSEEALDMALHFRPDCILIDLVRPPLARMTLCEKLASVSFTRSIPIVFITEIAKEIAPYKDLCNNLNVLGNIPKPVDGAELRARVAAAVKAKRPDRRKEPRIQLCVILKLCGLDASGAKFEVGTTTLDVSASGFSCGLPVLLSDSAGVDVFLVRAGDRFVGRARVAREGRRVARADAYGFEFVEKPSDWVVH